MNRRPTGSVRLGDHLVDLRADVMAAMCIHKLTGKTFHEIYQGLGVEISVEAATGGARVDLRCNEKDPEVWMDLIFAFSASWRYRTQFNVQHGQSLDQMISTDRHSGPYAALAMAASEDELNDAHNVLLKLLGDLLVAPVLAARAKDNAERSESKSPMIPTGITPTS